MKEHVTAVETRPSELSDKARSTDLRQFAADRTPRLIQCPLGGALFVLVEGQAGRAAELLEGLARVHLRDDGPLHGGYVSESESSDSVKFCFQNVKHKSNN